MSFRLIVWCCSLIRSSVSSGCASVALKVKLPWSACFISTDSIQGNDWSLIWVSCATLFFFFHLCSWKENWLSSEGQSSWGVESSSFSARSTSISARCQVRSIPWRACWPSLHLMCYGQWRNRDDITEATFFALRMCKCDWRGQARCVGFYIVNNP